ncbi:LysR substrate-binding domain-containing protein [Ottowia sp.]|uniref:LysR substrate-binding domain-containing protein n=1 Tax=Ottowia sp. TaxID=1898956 RepID=UPI002CE269E5|nr:LysR substrate-binding domain-containing protein [Ottowia sp.]HRN74578.1 LysR substrate-binding domain-containing protein [Ottowia sp.]HRQ01966.1 LysR substrate-binding domain-containing protein [Ottowia sp.]
MDDLNDLAYFAHVAEHGGFAATERATGIPKSKLSRRISALEARLGVRLIQRTTRRFALTDIGQRTLQHARAMLAEAAAAQALATEQTSAPRGTVRLSCPPALLQHGVGDMLARFLNAWPLVNLHVQATNRNVDVWQDGVDLALRVRAPGAALPQDEVVRPLALSPHVLVAAPALLTSAAPPATPAELMRLPTLGLGNSPDEARWQLVGPEGARAEVPLAPRLVADDMGALLCATLAGVGCAALPRLMAHELLAGGALQEVLPGWAPPPGLVQAAFASRQGMRPAVRQLLDTLAAGFDALVHEGRCLRVPPG